MPEHKKDDERDQREPTAAGDEHHKEDHDKDEIDEDKGRWADLEFGNCRNCVQSLNPASSRLSVDQLGGGLRNSGDRINVRLPRHLHGAPGDDVAARDAQDGLQHYSAANPDDQHGERCSCRIWNDSVVDLQDRKRESETEQIDDDRGRDHICRQARQCFGEKAQKAPDIARDEDHMLSWQGAHAGDRRTQSVVHISRFMGIGHLATHLLANSYECGGK